MVREKAFREDLFYRVNVIAIRMPSLREKPEDIPALAEHFLEKYRTLVGKPIRSISKAAMECLERYDWPGNVRQLENVVERAVALEASDQIGPESLPAEVRTGGSARPEPDVVLPDGGIDLELHLEALRRRYMVEALHRSAGVQTRAAELLGMTFRSFRYFAKKYELTLRDGTAGAEREAEEPTLCSEPS
jgi:two-component system response regulator PilR (NtrC family)